MGQVPGQMRLPGELVDAMCGCQPANATAPRVNARAEIVRLRAQGYGASETARVLNRNGVPTPTGRGRWHPDTVRRHADPLAAERWRRYIAEYRRRNARTG